MKLQSAGMGRGGVGVDLAVEGWGVVGAGWHAAVLRCSSAEELNGGGAAGGLEDPAAVDAGAVVRCQPGDDVAHAHRINTIIGGNRTSGKPSTQQVTLGAQSNETAPPNPTPSSNRNRVDDVAGT